MIMFRCILCYVAIGFAVAGGAEPPGEEEEIAPKKPVRKVVVEEEVPTGVAPNALPDMVRAAGAATHPSLRTLFTNFTVPFDRITDTAGVSSRVTPLPLVYAKDSFPKQYGVFILDAQNRPGEVVTLALAMTKRVEPFEMIAVADVEALFNSPKGTAPEKLAPLMDRYAAGERLLTQVLLFHESAVEGRKRQGKSWEPIQAAVDARLTALRLAWVKDAAKEKDWPRLRDLTTRFLARYKANPALVEELYTARLSEADELIASDKLTDLERVRDLLLDYDSRFPSKPSERTRRIRALLSARAKQFLAQAGRLSATNQAAARNLLRSVELLDPDQPGLQELRKQLKAGYSTLVVAARRPPEHLSPATARYDSERQIVELLFEGLLDQLPDEKLGVAFQPALSLDKPRVLGRSREVTLAGGAAWTNADAGVFDATDLLGTLRMLREKRQMQSAEAIDWFEDPLLDPADPSRVRLRFRSDNPDPRLLLTAKMLPARWLEGQKKAIDDDAFSKRPFGTGPFKLAPTFRPAEPGTPPSDIILVANPAYARRVGLLAQPTLQEIRLVPMASFSDPVAELREDRLHLVTDISTRELDRYAAQTQASIVTPVVNRRLHLLAINHRIPALQSADVRRGLLHAIDREGILNDVFRAGKKEYHKALTGPLPTNSWLTPKADGGSNTLFARDNAAAKLSGPAAPSTLTILYPNDEPQSKLACEQMKKQLEDAGRGGEKKLSISLEAVPPAEFYRRVYQEHRFELAYLTHDYSSDWSAHELAALLDPTVATADGRNCFSYRVKSTNPTTEDDRFGQLLADVRTSRDPERVRTLAAEIHRRFNETVPFLPLWQIDMHMAVSNKLRISFDGTTTLLPKYLDPVRLFQGAARWRME